MPAEQTTQSGRRGVQSIDRAVALAESAVNKPLRNDVEKCESANGIAGVLGVAAANATKSTAGSRIMVGTPGRRIGRGRATSCPYP